MNGFAGSTPATAPLAGRYSGMFDSLRQLFKGKLESDESLGASLAVVVKAPPVGDEHPSESSGKSHIPSDGAAKSAAVDEELALVLARWSELRPHAKATIMGIVRSSKLRNPESAE